MSFAANLYSWISADSAIAALVSTRIYPIQSPEIVEGTEMPTTLVYGQAGMRLESGLRNEAVAIVTCGFSCSSKKYDDAHALADALIARIFALIYPSKQTISGSRFEAVKLTDSRDDPDNTAVERGIFTVYVEFEISYV